VRDTVLGLAHLVTSVHFLLLLRRQPEWLDRFSRDPQNQREPIRAYL